MKRNYTKFSYSELCTCAYSMSYYSEQTIDTAHF